MFLMRITKFWGDCDLRERIVEMLKRGGVQKFPTVEEKRRWGRERGSVQLETSSAATKQRPPSKDMGFFMLGVQGGGVVFEVNRSYTEQLSHSKVKLLAILIHLSTPLSTEVGNKIPMILSPSPGRSLFGNRENIGFQYCHYSPCFRKQGQYWISVLSIFSLFPKTGRILTVLKSNVLPVCEFPLLKCMHGFHIELCDCWINYTLKGVLKYIRMPQFIKPKGSSASILIFPWPKFLVLSLSLSVNIGDSTPERFCYRKKEEESEEEIRYARQVFRGSVAYSRAAKQNAEAGTPLVTDLKHVVKLTYCSVNWQVLQCMTQR